MSMYYSYKTKGFYDANVHKERPEDSVEITDDLYNSLLNGIYDLGGNIQKGSDGKPYVEIPPRAEVLATAARTNRNSLLTASDWTMIPDAPVDQVAWATYRQELRDITAQAGFPNEVVWPTKP